MKLNIISKRLALAVLAMAGSACLMANHPDSVYVKPDVENGTRDFQIAYSVDGKHWKHVSCNLFESDFGTWGSEKKLHYPVLAYDGKAYHATFIPNPKKPHIATTTSENFTLWKPQDYPRIEEGKLGATVEEQKRKSESNVIRIPYADLQNLLTKQRIAEQNAVWERDNFVVSGKVLEQLDGQVNACLTVNWDDRKAISPNLIGIFFEDISYAADGGLYAELVQNRDFEYTPDDHKEWNAQTAWRLEGEGTTWSIATENPIHPNNAHYAVLASQTTGARLINEGWDGIVVDKGAKYNLTLFARGKGSLRVSLISESKTIASTVVKATADWKPIKGVLTASETADHAVLAIEPLQAGTLCLDFISLFPQDTYKGRANGLRKDLAEVIAELKPKFVRFPGGCATHGQGIDNIYHWQATIGELWERQPDMNIWHYHQTRGLGFYEYFLFCEDIGAEPLPVLAAGVPCQNSQKGGDGQQGGIPFEKDLNGQPSPYTYNGQPLTMESYLQELLDLIEWANGDAKSSELAKMRAKAGHPKPFNMKYLGIGNEDLIGDTFLERYRFLIDGIKKAHPEITVVGTVGPFWEGSDYEYGWREAKERNIEIVDEHYYNTLGWYFHHRDFYDNYDRNGTKVYLGEWASKGNNVANALVEAAYLAHVERNADVVVMSSYAPLLAKRGHTNWNPDLIYFDNRTISPTANYYVQRAFGQNVGDTYIYSSLEVNSETKQFTKDVVERIDKSVVIDSRTGDIIIKMVSLLPTEANMEMVLGEEALQGYERTAELAVLAQNTAPDRQKAWDVNEMRQISVSGNFTMKLPAYSLSVLRIRKSVKK